jgi:hypothetical protein
MGKNNQNNKDNKNNNLKNNNKKNNNKKNNKKNNHKKNLLCSHFPIKIYLGMESVYFPQ